MKEKFVLGIVPPHEHLVEAFDPPASLRHNNAFMMRSYDMDMLEFANSDKSSPIKASEFLWLVTQVVSAITHLHAHNVAHMDLKPDNFLLDLKTMTVRVSDLGMAKFTHTADGKHEIGGYGVTGSLMYIAPEVYTSNAMAEYDAKKADVFSLGITMFALLFNRGLWTKPSRKSYSFDMWVTKKIFCWYPLEDARAVELAPIIDLIKLMVKIDPTERPDMAEVETRMKALSVKMATRGKTKLDEIRPACETTLL